MSCSLALVAEAVYAVLRRKRSLEASVGSPAPRALLIAALVRFVLALDPSLDRLEAAGAGWAVGSAKT